jgi:hypothetical protein
VKIWTPKCIKTKGIICKFDNKIQIIDESLILETKGNKSIIAATTIVGTILPFALQYGSYAIQKATNVDEKDYKAEFTTVGSLELVDTLIHRNLSFSTELVYYKEGNEKEELACKYYFNFNHDKDFFKISLLKNPIKHNSLVKIKRKYDFVLTSFEISLKALVYAHTKNKKKQHEILDLGSQKNHLFSYDFKDNSDVFEIKNNNANFIIPKLTKEGESYEIKNLLITVSINYINPYGVTTSSINHFFKENSETNVDLIKLLMLGKDE